MVYTRDSYNSGGRFVTRQCRSLEQLVLVSWPFSARIGSGCFGFLCFRAKRPGKEINIANRPGSENYNSPFLPPPSSLPPPRHVFCLVPAWPSGWLGRHPLSSFSPPWPPSLLAWSAWSGGSTLRIKSTRVRSRAVSSFLRRARSDLFSFLCNVLSSRLRTMRQNKEDKVEEKTYLSLPSFYLLVKVLEAPPAIKVVPKIVECLHFSSFPSSNTPNIGTGVFLLNLASRSKHGPKLIKESFRVHLFFFPILCLSWPWNQIQSVHLPQGRP